MKRMLIALFVAVVVLEVLARWSGVGTPLLYEKTDYGYRVAPGQTITRLGKRVTYNELGLRNEAVAPLPADDTLRTLCLGDSITFGGTFTDQTQTWPYLLAQMLTPTTRDRRVEVLNASANGWATENEEGWLKANGTLGASWIVLQVASHDLFQEMSGAERVGVLPAFPEKAQPLALLEIWKRDLAPRVASIVGGDKQIVYSRTMDDLNRNLDSIARIAAIAHSAGASLVVMLVEQPRGIEPQDELGYLSKNRLASRLSELGVPLVRTAEDIEARGGVKLFRDDLHPNAAGNRVLAEALAPRMHSWIAADGIAAQRRGERLSAGETPLK